MDVMAGTPLWADRVRLYHTPKARYTMSMFVLTPDELVRDLDAFGAVLGDFAPTPHSELRFWVSLAFAYMVLVTMLAWIAQRDLRRYRHLLPILAAGKAASSLSCLLYYGLSLAAFPYLANFLIDGSITLVVLWIWADIPRLEQA
jgi:hypothetical protein